MTIIVHNYRTGSTNTNGSVDADVEIRDEAGDVVGEGEVTLLKDHQGVWSSWGSPDNWMSSDLLRAHRDLDFDLVDVLVEVDQQACEAVEPERYPETDDEESEE